MNFPVGKKSEPEGEPDKATARDQPWWYLLLAALFLFGFGGLTATASVGTAIGCGIAGFVALFCANQIWRKQVAAARAARTGTSAFAAKRPPQLPYWIVPVISLLPLGAAVEYGRDGAWFSAFLAGGFGALMLLVGFSGMLQQRQARRVARIMATGLASVAASDATDKTRRQARNAPGWLRPRALS